MKAAIVSTGDELVTGKTLDTNAHWLINRLVELDVETVCGLTVGDNRTEIGWALRQAMDHAPLVILTGGLGPTDDDLTRFVLADLAGVKLVEHAESIRRIEAFFKSRNRVMNDRNRVQALMPERSEPLDNPNGTAPGIKIVLGASTVFALPGVPREMKAMYDMYILPWVNQHDRPAIYRCRLHCIGIGESDLVHRVADLVAAATDVTFGTTANEGIISLGLVCKNKASLEQLERALRERLGPFVFGQDGDTLPSVVGRLLQARKEKLATAESCTGGLVGKLLTDVAGSSDYYLGGFVCYSNALKKHLLGVPDDLLNSVGAVSPQVAEAMAKGALEKTGADWSVAVTGIAGPGGATETKPVGLVYIALAHRSGFHQVREFRYGDPGREPVRTRTAVSALDLLRLTLLEKA